MAPEFAFDAFSTTAIVGSLVLVLFAGVVGVLAKMRGAALYYVLFAGGFSIGAMIAHLVAAMERGVGVGLNQAITPADYTPEMVAWATSIFWGQVLACLVALGGLVGLLRCYGGWRPRLLLLGLTVASVQVMALTFFHPVPLGVWTLGHASALFSSSFAWQSLSATMTFGSVAMAIAYVRDRHANQALLGAALAAYPILNGLWTFLGTKLGGAPTALLIWSPLVYAIVIIGAWAWASKTGEKAAQNVLAFTLIAAAVALIMAPFPQVVHMGGLARAIDVVVVAYAILRHQYLEVDVKLRWTISKTTVAAVFVAVFFMVSEGAAALFSEQWGTSIGIAAAGLLVFGIAPLMRIADRFAATAVPITTDPEHVFAAAVRAALADGNISSVEEAHLAEVAEGLGLSPTRMTTIRHQVVGP